MEDTGATIARRNSHLFFSYRVISRCYFHLPVLLFYFWNIEIGIYFSILFLAVYGLSSTLSSGVNIWLLNFLTQKQIVAAGEFAKAFGLFLLLWGTRQGDVSLLVLFLAQVVGGVGFTIAMSTDADLLRQVMAGDQSRFVDMQTKSQSWIFIATLLAGTAGSVIFDYNAQWPFIASMVVSTIAGFCVLAINVTSTKENTTAVVGTNTLTIQKNQRFWMLFYSLSRAFTLAPFIGFIPFYFIMVNVDPLLFGAVLSCFTLSAWSAIKVSNSLILRYGMRSLLIATGVMMLAALWCFGVSGWLAIHGCDYFITGLIALVLLGFGSGSIRPVTMANLDLSGNSGKERMMIFSIMERDFGLINAALLLAGSWLLVVKGISTLMLVFSLFYMISILIMGLFFGSSALLKRTE